MITYKILPGDSLSKIKKKLGIVASIDDIVKANPIIKDPNKIQMGWSLKLPETLSEIKAIRSLLSPTSLEGFKYEKLKEEHLEGFAPIIGPGGKEYFPPTARGVKPELIENLLKKMMEAGWTEKEIKTKPVTLKEVLPYLNEEIGKTMEKIPGLRELKRTSDWYYEKIEKPAAAAVREKVMEVGAKPIKFYKLSSLDIAAIRKADRWGMVDSAVANAYFERDMRNELTLGDFIQLMILKDRVVKATAERLLKIK